MTPLFCGQSVLGTISSAVPFTGNAAQEDAWLGNSNGTTTISPNAENGPAIAVSGVLTGASSGAVTTAKAALSALAGQTGPLLAPVGLSAVPGAVQPATLTAAAALVTQSPTYASYGPVATAPTSLVVSSVAGLAIGSVILVQSATSPVSDQATITAINTLTLTVAPPLRHGYAVGDLVTPLGALQPYQSLYPSGPATGGVTAYPGWDTIPGCYFTATDLVFGSTTGSGPYQCTYSLVLRRASDQL